MTIERILTRIPDMTTDQRTSLRMNAQAKLEAGAPQWVEDAKSVLEALREFEEEERQNAEADRTSRIASLSGASAAQLERFLTGLNHKGIPVAAVF